jgi:hypothetical protein
MTDPIVTLARWLGDRYSRHLAKMLRRTQAKVTRRFPPEEAQRRNEALQRMIDVLLRGRT